MKPLWYDINEFLIEMLGIEFNWLAIILTLSYILLAYSLFLVVHYLRRRIKIGITKPHLANRIIPFPIILIWNAMLYLLISEAGSELAIVRTQLENFIPIISFIILLGLSAFLVILIPRVVPTWKRVKNKKNEKITIILTLTLISLIYLSAFILPFVLLPSNVISTELPEKPKLMAHRGASHLAPENTIAAGEQAVAWGAIGWELDVAISYDGIIFMMHDSTLQRTTNIADIFPERANEPAANFTISELRQLDAGSWFVDQDPFQTISQGYVDSVLADSYIGEKIPTLAEVINLTRDNNLLLDIDTRRPFSSHPFYATYYEVLLTQLNESGLGKNILISSFDPLAENMIHVCGANTVSELETAGCELVNTHHGLTNKQFEEYDAANISVMVWTVDTPSRFSQLWCLGVDYVKTNSLHLFTNITGPSWYISITNYYIFWAILDFSFPALAIIICLIRKKKGS